MEKVIENYILQKWTSMPSLYEINIMRKSNVKFFTLGDRRLRAETAMVSTVSILNEILN